MKITIKSAQVQTKNGISKRTGNEYSIRQQVGQAETDEFRVPVTLTLGDEQQPYAPGVYDVDFERSVQIGRYGDPEFKREIVLIPLQASEPSKPSASAKAG